ncbi:MAG: FtsX-like permease family protein [Rhodocyclaceae bacterium]|nr:FtsX-like permease family protein [Rhodocyclaceae bacterium]
MRRARPGTAYACWPWTASNRRWRRPGNDVPRKISVFADLKLGLRLLLRDWRAGELGLLAWAVVLAVAAVASVDFFTDRVRLSVTRDANQLMGGDLLLVADHPWAPDYLSRARELGLEVAQSYTFTSMAASAAGAQLTGVKAVGAGYPLRGKLRLAPAPYAPDAEQRAGPAPGTVWLDERLTNLLQAKPGERIKLGRAQLTVGGVLTFESDRGASFFSFAPRLMLNAADLPATALIQEGSRVSYKLHLAGGARALSAYQAWAGPRLGRGERIEDASSAQPEVRGAIDRAQRMLRLAAMLAVVLAAVAIGLAARRFVERHLDGCAVMRCLGATQGRISRLLAVEFAAFGVLATAAGALAGYAIHFGAAALLAGALNVELPPPSAAPWFEACGVGVVLLAGFILPPLAQLRRVPTLRVLRREFGAARKLAWAGYAAGAALLAGLLFVLADDWKLGAAVAGGFVAAAALYAAAGWLLLWLVARARGGASGWRLGLANLRRRGAGTVVQLAALGLAFTALLMLGVTRGDLLSAWRARVPPDAPNRYLINIQPDQLEAVAHGFRAAGLEVPHIEPMVRGRLVAVDGRPVAAADYAGERAQRLVEREFNLSWTDSLPQGNRVVAGRWFGAGAAPEEFSVERGLAETLGLKLGQRLRFDVAGNTVEGLVTSLRALEWDSMRVNFFVIGTPALLAGQPASYITAFRLPAGRDDAVNALVREFPNLTFIDVSAVLRQIEALLDQLALGVQALFLFALAAGVLVLVAAIQATRDERAFEMALLRALGARNRQLRGALISEFALLGALAALLGAAGAALVGWAVAHFALQLPYSASLIKLALGAAAGSLLVLAAGWAGVRGVLGTAPLAALRAGA